MKEYKSPIKKLLKFFDKSRKKWKKKYLDKNKENKYLKNRIRFLESSKKKWRDETLILRKKTKKYSTKNPSKKDVISKKNCSKKNATLVKDDSLNKSEKKSQLIIQSTPPNEDKIPYHTYSSSVIHLLLQLILTAAVSFRGTERVLNVLNENLLNKQLDRIPSWYSVRSWFIRVGYYKLMRAKQIADDWCWILDHVIQLGKIKCFLILGIRLSQLPKNRALVYQDLEPIELFPVEKSNGDIVYEQLEQAAKKTGIPRLLLSDHGSDLKKGADKFCNSHDHCTSLYDIKHKTACLLKGTIGKDESWNAFRKLATQTKSQLQQTALSYLKPPKQRSKARYMNLEHLLSWGEKTLQIINSDHEFTESEREKLPKLEWLNEYKDKIEEWNESLQVTTLVEQQVRKKGITCKSSVELKKQFKNKLPKLKYQQSIHLKELSINFLKVQEVLPKKGETLPGSSEVIESIFGKQKQIERDYSKEGFTTLILGMSALVGETTTKIVKEALISTPIKKVTEWCKNKLGQTLHSKKMNVYSKVKKGTKMGSVSCCKV